MISDGLISLFYLFRKRRRYQAKEEVSTISIVASYPFFFSRDSYMFEIKRPDQSGTQMRSFDLSIMMCVDFFIAAL